jgi:hypothetical protein
VVKNDVSAAKRLHALLNVRPQAESLTPDIYVVGQADASNFEHRGFPSIKEPQATKISRDTIAMSSMNECHSTILEDQSALQKLTITKRNAAIQRKHYTQPART